MEVQSQKFPMSDCVSNYLLASLPSHVIGLLKADLEPVSLPQGLVLLEPDDPIERIYFPQTGMISLLVVTREGDTIETSVVGRVGALGLQRGLGKRRSLTRATVQIAGRFLSIAAYRFEQATATNTLLLDMHNRHT